MPQSERTYERSLEEMTYCLGKALVKIRELEERVAKLEQLDLEEQPQNRSILC
ncbi:hypothetical protein [Bacillus sp. FJAT-42315]|uniref:hypothetical protein n=1 Tax=Bacillus sp. FJAT-42315 TaxID=2014077 RepID=UPI0012FE986A|nr:hypothetical protein [Bacillus sp. FJAT-42315]